MKAIPGYEGLYAVTEDGRIFSLERWVPHTRLGRQFVPGMERKLSEHCTGYLTIRLAKGGEGRTHRVHRLVAEAFIPNPNNKPGVNHKDGNKHNNAVSNLEWVTELENIQHGIATGLIDSKGFANGSAKLSEDQEKQAYSAVFSGEKLISIAERLGLSHNTNPKTHDRKKDKTRQETQKPQYRQTS